MNTDLLLFLWSLCFMFMFSAFVYFIDRKYHTIEEMALINKGWREAMIMIAIIGFIFILVKM